MRRRSLLLLGLSAGAFGFCERRGYGAEKAPAFGPEIGFELVDTYGRLVRAADFRGRWLIVSFGYTFCPDLCPTTLNEIAEAATELGPLASRVQPIFISIDPERDTPQVLREYAASFDERILALTGTPEQLARTTTDFGIVFFKVPGVDGKDCTFAHSAFLSLVGPEGGLVARFSTDERSVAIGSALKALIKSE